MFTVVITMCFKQNNLCRSSWSSFGHNFPKGTIPIKMHMVEDHAVQWARSTHVGFGILGEQGAESIHAKFNNLARAYSAIKGKVHQFKCNYSSHSVPQHPLTTVVLSVKLAEGVAELLAAAKNSKDSTLRLLLPPTVLYIGHMPVYCMAAVSVEPGCQRIKGTPVGLILKQTDCLLIVVWVLEKDAQVR